MSEMKYTKGPWEHWAGNATMSVTGPAAAASMCAVRAIKEQGYGYCVELASIGQETPCIALGDTQERAEANARLIASAPDLLDALIAAELAFVEHGMPLSCHASLSQIRVAIDKATGQA